MAVRHRDVRSVFANRSGRLDLGRGEQPRVHLESSSFTFNISPDGGLTRAYRLISGAGRQQKQRFANFLVRNGGQLVFNNASTAANAQMSICNGCLANSGEDSTGETIFNGTSSAAGASIGTKAHRASTATSVERHSTAHRLLTTPPSPTLTRRSLDNVQ